MIIAVKKKGDRMDHNSWKLTDMDLHMSITPYPERRKTQGVLLYLTILIMFALTMPLLNQELATVKYLKGIAENVLVGIGKFVFLVDFIILGFEFLHANFFPNLPINVMSRKFYNSIMKDKIEFREKNELGNWADVPIFIGNFCVLTDFAVVEDMDPYLDDGMSEVIVREPFCKVSYVETKRFYGIITIHDKYESVTYHGAVNFEI
nr:hypothetical protein [Tanacetum cinerariifolium]